MEEQILKVKNLVVDFPIFGGIMQREVDSVHAVKKVSFGLLKGETLGIVGESGSGKSTLGNAILNVLNLTAPDVQIDGKSVSAGTIIPKKSKIDLILGNGKK